MPTILHTGHVVYPLTGALALRAPAPRHVEVRATPVAALDAAGLLRAGTRLLGLSGLRCPP